MDRSVSGAHRRSSMEGISPEKKDKQPAAPTLPASAEKQQQQQPHASRPRFLHISVQHVNQWTLTHAVVVTVGFAVAVAYYAFVVTRYRSNEVWLLLPRAATEATDADATQLVSVVQLVTGTLWCSSPQPAATAMALLLPCHGWRVFVLMIGMLWCSAPQAVAAALALLLPRHRRRFQHRAAAYTALALSIASHCMFAGAFLVFVREDPKGLFFRIMGTACIFISAVSDLLGFLALRSGGDDDDDLLGFLRGREE